MGRRFTVAQAEYDSIEDLVNSIRRENPDFNFDDGNGVEYKLFDNVDMPDGEKLVFFEGFCRRCDADTMHIYSANIKRFLCMGCGKRIDPRSLAEKAWGLVRKPNKNGGGNAH